MTAVTDPIALTVAGYDPSSGAGISADLAVFATHGIFGTSAITALTVQSTTGVLQVQPVEASLLADTLACLQEDLPPAGIKIGMLGGAEQVQVVIDFLREVRRTSSETTVVLDTVLRSSSGAALLSEEGLALLQDDLLPLVDCITPNIEELALLAAAPCDSEEQILTAAGHLIRRYPNLSVLATGGHRPRPDDILLHKGNITVLPGERVVTRATHGTGCALSSALLCGLIRGKSYPEAASDAKIYVAEAMRQATPRGAGRGPMHLMWPVSQQYRR